jgi:hypothetical protein
MHKMHDGTITLRDPTNPSKKCGNFQTQYFEEGK